MEIGIHSELNEGNLQQIIQCDSTRSPILPQTILSVDSRQGLALTCPKSILAKTNKNKNY